MAAAVELNEFSKNEFFGEHFLEIAQIKTLEQLTFLFRLASLLSEMYERRDPLLKKILETFSIAIQFSQQSSRTFGSFLIAAMALGANVVPIQDMVNLSSVYKGEKLGDSAVTAAYSWLADIIIQRHPDDRSSHEIAEKLGEVGSNTLVINAGSGIAEHPTQALLDAYAIFKEFGRLDNLHIVFVGDMKNGRTVKSLLRLLAKVAKGVKCRLVAPVGLEMQEEVLVELEGKVEIEQSDTLEGLENVDIFYWTRVQREWFQTEKEKEYYQQIKNHFILTPEFAAQHPNAKFFHPLPRVGEIDERMDADPRAFYLTKEMGAGPRVRMALMVAMLIENPFLFIQQLQEDEQLRKDAEAFFKENGADIKAWKAAQAS